jgi:hypothetical protein
MSSLGKHSRLYLGILRALTNVGVVDRKATPAKKRRTPLVP